ncbi:MAG: DNA alkylation repair protein [Candidatus Aminicenantes bacterium]|jgi:3-methyladenine DNA glycosylase AlkD
MKSHNFTPEAFARHAIKVLKTHADPIRAKQGQKYFKDQVFILGFTAGKFRQVANGLFGLIKPYWTHDEALALCDLMLPDLYLEVKGLSIYILEQFIKSLQKKHLSLIKQWIDKNYCDNWASIDSMCTYIISPLIGFYPELVDEVACWAHEDNPWLRRASAVAFVKHVRKGRHIETVHRIANTLFADNNDLVQKANGWLLRESGKKDMKNLEKFLLKHGKTIPRTTLRYAIEKFPDIKRKEILVKTRG